MVHQFALERFEKALSHCIVPTVAPATHALYNWQALQLVSEFTAGMQT